jgi:prepilin-type N-terminal cleavage/methylation domain-containing protein
MTRRDPSGAPCPRRGFTLIEILAVILIISILAVALLPQITPALERANVTACREQLSDIYEGLVIHEQKYGDLPQHGGVAFFASLIQREVWENTDKNAKRLTCPAVKISAVPGLAGVDPQDWFRDLALVDGDRSTYAGRDVANHPLRKFPGSGKEALVADDNYPEMNHDTTTLCLFADGSVTAYELVELREQGVLSAEDQVLVVGPDSPVEELRTLSLD